MDIDQLRDTMVQRYDPATETLEHDDYLEDAQRRSTEPGDVAALYHHNTKLTETNIWKTRVSAQMFNEYPPLVYTVANIDRDQRGTEFVPLPNEPLDRDISLARTLRTRRSIREYSGEPVSLADLSTLLGYAVGVTGTAEVSPDGAEFDEQKLFRSYPSGGGLYPVEIYVAAMNVDSLVDGVYYYVPADHGLRRLAAAGSEQEPFDDHVADLFTLPEDTLSVSEAGFVVFLTGAFNRSKAKYGPRGYRLILQESGHAAQNVQLVASALGLGSIPVAAYFDNQVDDLLGVDGVEESIVYPVIVGDPDTDTNE